jgi:hypothetical protein
VEPARSRSWEPLPPAPAHDAQQDEAVSALPAGPAPPDAASSASHQHEATDADGHAAIVAAAPAPVSPPGPGPRTALADSTTVEGVLESAIYAAGMMAESNFGDLFKVRRRRT